MRRRRAPYLFDPESDCEDALFVCECCGEELNANFIADECPCCGEEIVDDFGAEDFKDDAP